MSLQFEDDLHAIEIRHHEFPRHLASCKLPQQIPNLEFLRETKLPGLFATLRTLRETLIKALRHLEDYRPWLVRLTVLAAHARKDSIAAKHSEILKVGRLQKQADDGLSLQDNSRLSKVPAPRAALTGAQFA